MRDTWYILDDETTVNPAEVSPDESGILRHVSGTAVAIGSHGNPRTRGVDVDADGKLLTPKPAEETGFGKSKGRQMKPSADKPGYETRENKAD